MKRYKVKDLMIPLSEYGVVSKEATLFDAILALEDAQRQFDQQSRYTHRAVLVKDEQGRIIGKLSQHDVLRGFEPGYKEVGDLSRVRHWQFSLGFTHSMQAYRGLWQGPLEDILDRGARTKVKDIMYTPEEGEYVQESAPLDEAIHQLVVGHHQSLLVVRVKSEVVGILRLTDLFAELSRLVKERVAKAAGLPAEKDTEAGS